MLPIAQLPTSSPSGGLPPLPEGPSLDRLRPPPGAESGPETWQILVVLLGLLAIIACLLLLYRNRTRKNTRPARSRSSRTRRDRDRSPTRFE